MNTKPYVNFDVVTDHRGVTTVTLDVPERPLNVLDHHVMSELGEIVSELETASDVKLVVIQSGKESGFLAGADVSAISSIESASEANRLLEDGQLLMQRIEWLPMPTIAVIHGPCLGGGLELALACNYRVARHNSSTKIGLPEIKLGLIPAWGGTQRLPKRVGLTEALGLILTGKHLDAMQASRMGLVDRAIRPEQWSHELSGFIDSVLAGDVPEGDRGKRTLGRRLLDGTGFGRSLVMRMAARSIRSKTRQYPALNSALKAIRLAYEASPQGYACERKEFVQLLATPTCRNLLDLFFARERARSLKTWSSGVGYVAHDMPTRKVGVIGAGAMGAGIGQLASYRGFDVVIKEINDQAAAAGWQRIEKSVASLARRKGWGDAKRDELLGRINISCDDESLAECDLVVEAVVERADIKAEVFGTMDRVVKKSAILSSNTSSLSVTDMAQFTSRPSQVAGLHFFNPVHRMELVEVVRARHTDDETIARLVGFVRALGKTPVVTADSPGFLVNRVLFPYLGEAVRMVGEWSQVEEMDKQVRRFGMPMGPLELLDQVGLDVALHVARSLNEILPGVVPVVDQLSSMVDQGRLGKKSGMGFYRYKKGKRVQPTDQPQGSSSTQKAIGKDYGHDGMTSVQQRLIYPMLAESIRCYEQRVVEQPWAIDLAMVLGTGFAPHHGGPLHLVDAIGPRIVMDNLNRLQATLGDRFAPPKLLVEMVESNRMFFSGGNSAAPTLPASS